MSFKDINECGIVCISTDKLQNIVFALGVKGLKYEGFFSCKRDLNIELQC